MSNTVMERESSVTDPSHADVFSSFEKLRPADRCDTRDCGAQAHVRMALGFSVIDFCGHHHAAHRDALTAQGFAVAHDTRHTLTNA